MEEIIDILIKKAEEKNKDIKKNFRTASELGIRKGDVIHYKNGEFTCVNDADELMCRFKNIVEVRRPVEWKTVQIVKPRRGNK